MKAKIRYAALFFAALSLLTGCAGVSKETVFSEVQQQVDERIGASIQWNQDTASIDKTEQIIHELLEEPLIADTAVQIALLHNRRLQATYEEIGIAQAAVVEAGSISNPAFHGGVAFGLPQDATAAHPAHDHYVFEIEMDFLSVLYASMRKSATEPEFEAAKLRVMAAVMDLAGQTRMAFYRAQAETQTSEMFRQVVLATEAAYEFTRKIHEAGNVPDLNLLLERTLYERSKLAFTMAEATLVESREQLNRLMGLWGEDTAWIVEPRLPDIPTDPTKLADLEGVALETSIDLAIAREGIVAIGKQLGIARTMALVPHLDIGGELEEEAGAWKAGPSVGFQIPIFDRRQGQRAAAAAELRRRQEDYHALAVEIRSAVRAAHRRLSAARQTALFYRDEMLPLQGQILEQVQLQYNAMQIGTPRLLLAKQQQIDAGREYIESLYNYHVARAKFDQIINGRLVLGTGEVSSPVGTSTVRHLEGMGAEGGH